jgi:hypothetical protein
MSLVIITVISWPDVPGDNAVISWPDVPDDNDYNKLTWCP